VAPGTCTGSIIACTGASDCAGGKVCCAPSLASGSMTCQSSCGAGVQFCNSSAECPSPQTCAVSAYLGYKTCR
jgi:hypothetical protein